MRLSPLFASALAAALCLAPPAGLAAQTADKLAKTGALEERRGAALLAYARTQDFPGYHNRNDLEVEIFRLSEIFFSMKLRQMAEPSAENAEELAEVATVLGYRHAVLGHHVLSAGFFREAVAVRRDDPDLLHALGEALADMGFWKESEEALQRSLTERPDDHSTNFAYGYHLHLQERFREAEPFLSKAVAECDEPEQLGFYLLWDYLNTKAFGGTLPDYERAHALDEGIWSHAMFLFLLGTLAEADLVEIVRSAEPEQRQEHLSEVLFFTGNDHLVEGTADFAREFFRECLLAHVPGFYEHRASAILLRRLAGRD